MQNQKKKYPQDVLDLLRFHVYKRRKDLKLKVKKIVDSKAKKEIMYTQDNSEIKYLPFTSTTGMEVLGDVTMVMMYAGPTITILIRSKDVAEDYRKQLKFLWSIAKK